MARCYSVFAAVLALFVPAGGGAAAADAPGYNGPKVVELFTSQSCSSCPPAEALFSEVAARADIVALEWHVDYWNDLVAGAAGAWRDPYSQPANTDRQRAYNKTLRGRASVYTPQLVVNGAAEAIGSDADAVDRLLTAAEPTAIAVAARRTPDRRWIDFAVSDLKGALATYVVFERRAQTLVARGENEGRTLRETHIVLRATPLRETEAGGFRVPQPAASEGCALLLHEPGVGRIVGAAYCPG